MNNSRIEDIQVQEDQNNISESNILTEKFMSPNY